MAWHNSIVDINPKEVGERIAKARELAGFKHQRDLAAKVFQDSEKKGRRPVSDETVRRWELGLTLPPWKQLMQLTRLLGIDGEEILFGPKRGAQLRAEHPRLIYVTPQEADLIVVFRHASGPAQRRIMASAQALADDDPAPTAEFHLLKPKRQ